MQRFPGPPSAVPDKGVFDGVAYRAGTPAEVLDALTQNLGDFLSDAADAGFDGLLLGLSGGVDSLMCAELCRRTAGTSCILTATVLVGTPAEQGRLAALDRQSAALGLDHVELSGEATLRAVRAAWPESGPWSPINIETRVVQTLLFQVADSRNLLVCSTRDRSEQILGRFTEGFYGHVAPLRGIYKTEVIELARHCGILPLLAEERPGCPGHWYDDEVLGAGYEVIDPLLHLIAVEGMAPAMLAARYGIADLEWIKKLEARLSSQKLRISTSMFATGMAE